MMLRGYKQTEEHKKNISNGLSGHKVSKKTKEKISKANSGRILKQDAVKHKVQKCLTCSKEFKRNMIRTFCSNKCRANFKKRIERECNFCNNKFLIINSRKGIAKYCSMKCYAKSLEGKTSWSKGMKFPERSGQNHFRWIVDRNKLAKKQERNDVAYKEWRKQVWIRDNYKCKINNKDCFGKIQAHHILSWREYLKLRYEINNGITLCQAHHPRKRAEEKRLIPIFKELVPVSNRNI